MAIRSITFTLKTSSALFMHGADKKNAAELRAPSIKGMMRFWFRALAGGLTNVTNLKSIEAEIFGSSKKILNPRVTKRDKNTKEGGQGICVRVRGDNLQSSDRKFLLPHKPDCSDKTKKDKLRSPAPAFVEGIEFKVILSQNPRHDSKFLDAAVWSLWLAVNLGGFGQRARRGAGSLSLNEVHPPFEKLPSARDFASPESLRDYLEIGLKEAKSCFIKLMNGSPNNLSQDEIPKFPILTPSNSCIKIINITNGGEKAAREQIMKRISKFKDIAWGLPYRQGETKINARMASPVWFHLVPKQEGGFFLIQTQMKSEFPGGLKREPNWKRIEEYFTSDKALKVDIP